MRNRLASLLILPFLLIIWSGSAVAQHKENSSSDAGSDAALIRRGLDLRQKGQDEAALKEFRRAYEMSTTGRALAQIALAEQALGRWLEAETHLTEALTHTQEGWITRNRKHLDQALNDIQGHLGSLELPGNAKTGTVKVDGVQMATLPLTSPLRVPAGSIALEVQAPGYVPIFRNVVVPARGLARERLVFVAVAAAKPVAPGKRPAGSVTTEEEKPLAPTSAPTSNWGPGRTVGVILGVAALGALGTGVTFHIDHESRAKSYKDHGCESDLPPADCQSRYNSTHSAGYIAIAGYAGAAVLGGVAIYLLASGPNTPARDVETARAGLRFQCSPTAGLGVVCAGSF
jgi:hypothetical protein